MKKELNIKHPITILAIDTSCDDTSISAVKIAKNKKETEQEIYILSNIVSSQIKIHQKYGGVYPALAKREHQKNAVKTLEKALEESNLLRKKGQIKANRDAKSKILKKILEREEKLYKKLEPFLKKHKKPNIQAIAVTIGPGLEPCLWVGVNFAKALAFWWNLPIIPVNHIEGHILVNLFSRTKKIKDMFPAISLVASGGHTQLILIKKIGSYRIIGETRDDAAGECFDKTARILGLKYPGGPAISAMAAKKSGKNKFKINLPKPMIHSKDYDFSFSGLKTAVLYAFKKKSKKTRKSKAYIAEMAKEIEKAICDVLIRKTIKAAKHFSVKSILIGGGVAANNYLKEKFREKIAKEIPKAKFYWPSRNLSTDNAAMIGIAGYFNYLKNKTKNWEKITVKANFRLKTR